MNFLLLLCLLPSPGVSRAVDVCELNHVICPTNNTELGVYWIWWRWQIVDGTADYYVVDWRKRDDAPWPIAQRQDWRDTKTKRHMTVDHRAFRETWSYYDREAEDRKRWPESRRRKL